MSLPSLSNLSSVKPYHRYTFLFKPLFLHKYSVQFSYYVHFTHVNSSIPEHDGEVGGRNGEGEHTLDCVAHHQALDFWHILKRQGDIKYHVS